MRPWLLALLVACGASWEDRLALEVLRGDLVEVEQQLHAETVRWADAVREAPAPVRSLAEAEGDAFAEARAHLDASRACTEGLRASERPPAAVYRGWYARCLQLAELAERASQEPVEAITHRTEAWHQGPARLLAATQALHEAEAQLAAQAEALLDEVRARHPEQVAQAEQRAAAAASSLEDVQVALTEVEVALQQARPSDLADRLRAVDARLAAAEARRQRLLEEVEALDRAERLVATAVERTATYWLRRVKVTQSRSSTEREYMLSREEWYWEQTDEVALRYFLANARDPGGRTAIRGARHGTLTLVTEGATDDPEPRTVRVDADHLKALYAAWEAADADSVATHHRLPEVDAEGLPAAFSFTGRLVLAHKPRGAWPDEWQVVVPVEGAWP